jgi:predicted Mrr-cat superfamily restriction endonuclease
MMLYSDLFEHIFADLSASGEILTPEDLHEYELIKEKKSKLSANQRRQLVAKVDRLLKEMKDERD